MAHIAYCYMCLRRSLLLYIKPKQRMVTKVLYTFERMWGTHLAPPTPLPTPRLFPPYPYTSSTPSPSPLTPLSPSRTRVRDGEGWYYIKSRTLVRDTFGILFKMLLLPCLASGAVIVVTKMSLLVRKKGKLPGKTIEQSYALEYGESLIQIQADDVQKGARG